MGFAYKGSNFEAEKIMKRRLHKRCNRLNCNKPSNENELVAGFLLKSF